MKEILIKYGISEETVNARMMLYNNTQSMLRSPDGDTPFLEITTGVLQGHTTPFIFIICLDYILKYLWTMTENSDLLKLKEEADDILQNKSPT